MKGMLSDKWQARREREIECTNRVQQEVVDDASLLINIIPLKIITHMVLLYALYNGGEEGEEK
jgi:hypothetical protein